MTVRILSFVFATLLAHPVFALAPSGDPTDDSKSAVEQISDIDKASLQQLVDFWRQTNEKIWMPRNAKLLAEINHLERIDELITQLTELDARNGKPKSIRHWREQLKYWTTFEQNVSTGLFSKSTQLEFEFAKKQGHYKQLRDLISKYIDVAENGTQQQIDDFFRQQRDHQKQIQQRRRKTFRAYTDNSIAKTYEKHIARFKMLAEKQFAKQVKLDDGQVFTRTSIRADFLHGVIDAKYKSADGRCVGGQFSCYSRFKRQFGKLQNKYPIVRDWKTALTVSLNKKRLLLDFCTVEGKFTKNEFQQFLTKTIDIARLDSMKLNN